MENTKVYKIFQGLPPASRHRIAPFLANYTGGVQTLTYKLYLEILHHLEYGSGVLKKEEIWNKLHEGRKYKDQTFRKLCADLTKNVESALSALHLEESELDRRLHYLRYLKDQNFDYDLIKKEIAKSNKMFFNKDRVGEPGYYHWFRLEELGYENEYRSGSAWKKSNINRIDEYLNAFFVLEKLRLALSIFTRQKYIQFERELPFLEVIFELIESGRMDDYPLIKLYHSAVLTYQGEDGDAMYHQLKTGLLGLPSLTGNSYVRELITIALSYCIGKINQNFNQFYREALDWYQVMIRENMLIEHDHLAATTYRNIILIAIRLQEYDWAIDFAQTYSVYLKPDTRESTMMLSLGQIAFNQKDYDQVLHNLMNVDYLSLSYNLQSKLILAATYYEIGEYDLLTNFLATFSTYIRRKKQSLSPDKYQRHRKFINVLTQITKTPVWEKRRWKELQRQLESDPEIVSYSWLMEKVAEHL
ncbi:MAG TPA: hypothetical protein VKZ56_04130 [Membranihabitans sp.]|nr:hypothetical protein [Membranihabitans sp.]